jgi:hypothetical protein
MNEPYLLQTLAYVELNPVKANTPYNYCWSSAEAHKVKNKTKSITSNIW